MSDTERGILSPADRAFLRGEKDYANDQIVTNTRYRIRKRVRTALKDFALLLQDLPDTDREQILTDIRSATHRGELAADEEYQGMRNEEFAGLVYAIGFCYVCAQDADLPFEEVLEHGILAADRHHGGPFPLQSVEVDISTDHHQTLAEVTERIEHGETIPTVQYLQALRVLTTDIDQFVSRFAPIDIDLAQRLEARESLSVGESLVFVARTIKDPDQFADQMDDYMNLLHDRVTSDLGLTTIIPNNSLEKE